MPPKWRKGVKDQEEKTRLKKAGNTNLLGRGTPEKKGCFLGAQVVKGKTPKIGLGNSPLRGSHSPYRAGGVLGRVGG